MGPQPIPEGRLPAFVRDAPHFSDDSLSKTLRMLGHKQKANPGEQLARVRPPKPGPQKQCADLAATGVMIAHVEDFQSAEQIQFRRVVNDLAAMIMIQRASDAYRGFNTGGTHDFAGFRVFQHEQIAFVAWGTGMAVKTVHGMTDFLGQEITVIDQ